MATTSERLELVKGVSSPLLCCPSRWNVHCNHCDHCFQALECSGPNAQTGLHLSVTTYEVHPTRSALLVTHFKGRGGRPGGSAQSSQGCEAQREGEEGAQTLQRTVRSFERVEDMQLGRHSQCQNTEPDEDEQLRRHSQCQNAKADRAASKYVLTSGTSGSTGVGTGAAFDSRA